MLPEYALQYLNGKPDIWIAIVRNFMNFFSTDRLFKYNKTFEGITIGEVVEEALYNRQVIVSISQNDLIDFCKLFRKSVSDCLLNDFYDPQIIPYEWLEAEEDDPLLFMDLFGLTRRLGPIRPLEEGTARDRRAQMDIEILYHIIDPKFNERKKIETIEEYKDSITRYILGEFSSFVESKELWVQKPEQSVRLNKDIITNSLSLIDNNFYKMIVSNPELLKTLNWRVFEKLLADMLETFGYEVQLMQGTKDGGIDVIAFMKNGDFGTHKYLLQAKRWTNKVDIDVVKNVMFNHDFYKASKSCLATTATFTKGAWELAELYKWQLELKDYSSIQNWLNAAYKKRSKEQ